MEIKHLRLVKTIAEEGSIANSSEKLFLTQSALSHQLRELEERLGFKVFARSRQKWELTEQGKELHKLANKVLETMDQSFKNIEDITKGSKGTVRISTECYAFYTGLPSFVQKMGILYPHIDVSLINEPTHQPIDRLMTDDIDMAIVSSNPSSNGLVGVPLCEEEIFAVMHEEHELASKSHLTARDFENVHLIIHSKPLETVFVYEEYLKPSLVMPKQVSALPMTEIGLEMVSANMGIMTMPKRTLDLFSNHKNLVTKSIGEMGLKRTLYLVSRVKDQSKKYIKDFVSTIQEEFLV